MNKITVVCHKDHSHGYEDFEGKCLLCVVDGLLLDIANLMVQNQNFAPPTDFIGPSVVETISKREWVGLATGEAREFYESDLSREELIHKIDEFLQEKNT
jgi:hypothetical protein